jgi:hypothetical protein
MPSTVTGVESWSTSKPELGFKRERDLQDCAGPLRRWHKLRGRRTFTHNMKLLLGTYTFGFNDGTANTSYALVVGAVMDIH